MELYARQAAEFIDHARPYREIREADRHKDEFLAMLAHELRNPLSPLANALHILGQDRLEAAEAEQVRDIAERQVRHLARPVDDLLDVSRISNGKIRLRRGRMDLGAAVARAVDSVRPLIESRGHDLSISLPAEPVPLEADSSRLEQVLSNLLNNAAKDTEPGGRIDLRAGKDGEQAFVRIGDTGIGIAPELLPRVFDLFTQEERSRDRSPGGLGIGLTLEPARRRRVGRSTPTWPSGQPLRRPPLSSPGRTPEPVPSRSSSKLACLPCWPRPDRRRDRDGGAPPGGWPDRDPVPRLRGRAAVLRHRGRGRDDEPGEPRAVAPCRRRGSSVRPSDRRTRPHGVF